MLHSPTVPNTEKSLGANCLECYLQVSLVVWQVTGRNMAPAISETIHLQQQQWGSIFSQFDDQSLIHSHSSGYLHWWDSILNICQQVETDSPLLLLTWTSPAFPVFFFSRVSWPKIMACYVACHFVQLPEGLFEFSGEPCSFQLIFPVLWDDANV